MRMNAIYICMNKCFIKQLNKTFSLLHLWLELLILLVMYLESTKKYI